jgi:hypothetical protein
MMSDVGCISCSRIQQRVYGMQTADCANDDGYSKRSLGGALMCVKCYGVYIFSLHSFDLVQKAVVKLGGH